MVITDRLLPRDALLPRFVREHAHWWVRGTELEVNITDTDALAESGEERIGSHRNTLARSHFGLDRKRFGQPDGAPGSAWGHGTVAASMAPNLVDIVESAVINLSDDGICVTRPVGSLAYLADGGEPDWPLVRDFDVWCYVSPQTMASMPIARLHGIAMRESYHAFARAGITTSINPRSDFVYLYDRHGPARLFEIKLASTDWLHTRLAHCRMNFTMRFERRPAHALNPRKDWSVYAPFENHYATAAAEPVFAAAIGRLTRGDVCATTVRAYRNNLSQALSRFGLTIVTQAIRDPRHFAWLRTKTLKVAVFLHHLRREPDRLEAAHSCLRVDAGSFESPRQRVAELEGLLDNLLAMRTVSARALMEWTAPSMEKAAHR